MQWVNWFKMTPFLLDRFLIDCVFKKIARGSVRVRFLGSFGLAQLAFVSCLIPAYFQVKGIEGYNALAFIIFIVVFSVFVVIPLAERLFTKERPEGFEDSVRKNKFYVCIRLGTLFIACLVPCLALGQGVSFGLIELSFTFLLISAIYFLAGTP